MSIPLSNIKVFKEATRPIFFVDTAKAAKAIENIGGCAVSYNVATRVSPLDEAGYESIMHYLVEQAPRQPIIIAYHDEYEDDAEVLANAIAFAGWYCTISDIFSEASPNTFAPGELKALICRAEEEVAATGGAAAALKQYEAKRAERKEAYIQSWDLNTTGDQLTRFLENVGSEKYKAVKTGLDFFDDLLGGGILRQTVAYVCAAPGAGKTTLCQQLAEAIAANKQRVVYLNFEMSEDQMLAKAIGARLSGERGPIYTHKKILQGYAWTSEEWGIITNAVEEYKQTQWPYIRYNSGQFKGEKGASPDLRDLEKYLDHIGKEAQLVDEPAPVVILDYMHLISSREGLEDVELIKQTAGVLRNYAINYNTFVIGIIAANRESMKGKKLNLYSGRDTSNLEYSCDYFVTLNYYEVEYGEADPTNNETMGALNSRPWRNMVLRLAKNRYGEAGNAKFVYFNPARNLFIDGCKTTPDGAAPFNIGISPNSKISRL